MWFQLLLVIEFTITLLVDFRKIKTVVIESSNFLRAWCRFSAIYVLGIY